MRLRCAASRSIVSTFCALSCSRLNMPHSSPKSSFLPVLAPGGGDRACVGVWAVGGVAGGGGGGMGPQARAWEATGACINPHASLGRYDARRGAAASQKSKPQLGLKGSTREAGLGPRLDARLWRPGGAILKWRGCTGEAALRALSPLVPAALPEAPLEAPLEGHPPHPCTCAAAAPPLSPRCSAAACTPGACRPFPPGCLRACVCVCVWWVGGWGDSVRNEG